MNTDLMFSSKSNEWATPREFFAALDAEFRFNLDPCATPSNAKCSHFFTQADNGLIQDWGGARVFCNPPYGRELPKWVKKCHDEAKKDNTLVVMLIPARTDTSYFHEYIYHKAEIRFIRGRLKFGDGKSCAPFPSMVVIYNNANK